MVIHTRPRTADAAALPARFSAGRLAGMSKRASASPGPADQPGDSLVPAAAKKRRDAPGSELGAAVGTSGEQHDVASGGAKAVDSEAQGGASSEDKGYGAHPGGGGDPNANATPAGAASASAGLAAAVGGGGSQCRVGAQGLDRSGFSQHVHLTWQRLRKERKELNQVRSCAVHRGEMRVRQGLLCCLDLPAASTAVLKRAVQGVACGRLT